MSWITAAKKEQKTRPAFISVANVKPGQVFSLTEDSRPFRMVGTCKIPGAGGQLVDFIEVRSADTNNKELLPLSEYQNVPVVIRKDPQLQEKVQAHYYDFDRVLCKQSGVKGTILRTDSIRYPDVRATVLLDNMVNGSWIVECSAPDIEPITDSKGRTVIDDRINELREIASIVQETKRDSAQEHNKKLMDKLNAQITKIAAERSQALEQIERATEEEVNKVVAAVMERWPNDIKRINEACVNAITAGANNYEIGMIPEVLRNYSDDIYNKVVCVSNNLDIHVRATESILNKIANAALNGYFILRKGYIKPLNNGGWAVYARSGELLGKHSNRKRALSQIRAMEWRQGSQ